MMEKCKEYLVAFIAVGSWCTILVMLFLAEQFATQARVVWYILTFTISGAFTASLCLYALFQTKVFGHPKICVSVISLAALASNIGMFEYNVAHAAHYKNVPAFVLSKGVTPSKKKQFNGGKYCEVQTQFGIFELQVAKELDERTKIRDTFYLDFEIGKLNFIRISQ